MADLAQLIALECHLAQDQAGRAEPHDQADRDFLQGYQRLPERPRLLLDWLQHQDHEADLAGHWRRRFATVTASLLLLAGLLGAGAAGGALAKQPADLFLSLGVLLIIPTLLLLILLVTLLWGGSGSLVTLLQSLIHRAPALRGWLDRQQLHTSRLRLFAPLERLALLSLSQRAAVCAMLGMLLVFGLRVTFTDLRFNWDTSLPVTEQSQRINRFSRVLATPWAQAWPAAVPDQTLVLTSRGEPAQPAPTQRWWPFLLMVTLVYGLLPRLLLVGLLHWRLRRRLAAWTFDDAACLVLDGRLRTRFQGWQQVNQTPSAAPVSAEVVSGPSKLPVAWALRWNDIPVGDNEVRTLLPKALVGELYGIGNQIDDIPTDAPAVLVLAEAWEAPSKGIRHALAQLRRRLAERTPIQVLLLDGEASAWRAPSAEDQSLWRRRLSELADPYLQVGGLEHA